jgi:hypothetical protein
VRGERRRGADLPVVHHRPPPLAPLSLAAGGEVFGVMPACTCSAIFFSVVIYFFAVPFRVILCGGSGASGRRLERVVR